MAGTGTKKCWIYIFAFHVYVYTFFIWMFICFIFSRSFLFFSIFSSFHFSVQFDQLSVCSILCKDKIQNRVCIMHEWQQHAFGHRFVSEDRTRCHESKMK